MQDASVPRAALPRRIHLLGIGGSGLSAAARVLLARGHVVTGHDRAPSGMLEALEREDVQLSVGPSDVAMLPGDAALVVRSAAVGEDDPQVVAAKERGVPVMKYAELLARLAPPERTLAIAGTHGKSTTTWMTWHACEGVRGDVTNPAGVDREADREAEPSPAPGVLAGAISLDLESNAVVGHPDGWFCVEACEYDRSFLRLAPFGAVVTNVEGDHLDYYGSIDKVEEAFARFCSQIDRRGLLVLGADVPEKVEHAARCTVWRLGRELSIDLLGERRGAFRFRLCGPGWCVPETQLAVPGAFNVDNAALALGLAVGVGRPGSYVPASPDPHSDPGLELGRFRGLARRFETWGEEDGITLVHDYAHHPTEVRVTLEAARRALPGRPLHVLFQPHQHSRTARFLEEFCESLRSADRVVVTDVYGARAHIDGSRFAGSAELASGLKSRLVDAVHGGDLERATAAFVEGLPPEAAALVIGAGDIETIRDDLLDDLALRASVRRGSVR